LIKPKNPPLAAVLLTRHADECKAQDRSLARLTEFYELTKTWRDEVKSRVKENLIFRYLAVAYFDRDMICLLIGKPAYFNARALMGRVERRPFMDQIRALSDHLKSDAIDAETVQKLYYAAIQLSNAPTFNQPKK